MKRVWLASSLSIGIFVAVTATATAAPPTPADELVARARERMMLMGAASPGTPVEAGVMTPAQFDAAIDATWGPGLPTTRKLEIFDQFWATVDREFATFQGIEDVDWSALRDQYRPEIAAGVSRGRFAAIMNHLSVVLRESHTQALDGLVNNGTLPQPGVPLLWQGAQFPNTFGACVTAQDDGSALVIQVSPGHPLGLEPGDRVLGFEGRPWTDWYPELLAAELPMFPLFWGSSPSSFHDSWVSSGPMNWHLFDTIDVVKHDTGNTVHLSTAPLQSLPLSPMCSEQPDLPGVAKPQMLETNFQNVVSWGVLPRTDIGYIYVWGWFGDAGPKFTRAIEELTQQRQTDGLIIDFRFNLGGNMFLSDAGLGMLFDQPEPTIGFAERARPDDHFKMAMSTPPALYVIDMFDGQFDPRSYDKPIAVLTGPGAVSAGDQVALRMTYHPRVRTFGRSTATAFNAPSVVALDPGWFARIARFDAYRVEDPKNYLTHDEFVVDEPVWLTPDDAAAGRDTVVEAAVNWITNGG